MTAIFKIDQPGSVPPIPSGAWDRARRDLQLFGTGGSITFTAQGLATSYLWELISQPPGSSALLVNPTSNICTVDLTVTGGYLIRLTVNGGLSTEDVCVRYVGIPLPNSGLSIPAFNECDFDNSIDPLAVDGWSEKMTGFFKWADTFVMPNLASVLAVGNSAGANPLNMNGNRIVNVGTAIVAGNALTYGQVGAKLMGLDSMGSVVTNVGLPVSPGDAANKYYVDGMFAGLSLKDSVRVSTIVPEALSDLCDGYTVDTVVLADGDRILVRAQAVLTENGIYDVHGVGVPPTRALDCAAGTKASGAWTIAEEGSILNSDQAWLCTTDSAVFGDAITWTLFLSIVPISLPYHVYIDQNGSNVTGDGTFGKPYATLAYACTQQADPDPITGIDTFLTPIVFHVGPGLYMDSVVYPQRIGVVVHGEDCVLSGTHSWNINPIWWTAFSLDTGVTPFMVFEGATCTPDVFVPAIIPGGTESRQFLLQNGDVKVTNINPSVSTVPEHHTLILSNVLRDGFRIWNASGATLLTDFGLGDLHLFLNNARCTTPIGVTSYIAGEADRVDDGMGGGIFYSNAVHVWAEDSDVDLAGICVIKKLTHCNYSADWRIDCFGNPYVYGWVGGDHGDKYGERVQVIDSSLRSESFFGYDSSAATPGHSDSPSAIVFDKVSLWSLSANTNSLAASFADFGMYLSQAFGRGWFFEDDDLRAYNFVVVPCLDDVDGIQAGKLFNHTLSTIGNWQPNGSVLDVDNRVRVNVGDGFYRFEVPVLFNSEYVDVVGTFAIGEKVLPTPLGAIRPKRTGTIFQFGELVGAEWLVEDSSLEGVWMERDWASSSPAQDVFKFFTEGSNSTFKNLWFAAGVGVTGYIPNAVGVGFVAPGMKIKGKWQDCGTSLDGLFHECSIDGIFVRCVGKSNSFAGGAVSALDGQNVCSGYFEDCAAVDYSFGATNGGGDAHFLALKAVRCKGRRKCFGATNGGGDAVFNAQAEDCSAYAESFGAAIGAGNGSATCSGTLINCRLSGREGGVV